MLKHQKERKVYMGRPNRDEEGITASAYSAKERRDMEEGSQQLLSALMRYHPNIIAILTRKNGTGKGQFTLLG